LARERRARKEAEAIAERTTTDLYQAVGELARAKAVLDETTDFVAITDPAGRPSYVNRMLTETFGLALGDSRSLFDLLTPSSRGRLDNDLVGTLPAKGIVRDEFAFVRDGNGEIPVSAVLIAHRSPTGQIESLSFVGRDITEQRAMHDQLTHLALHDPLTSLPNRRLFFECLDLAIARASRTSSTCAVLVIDLDGFKTINDTLGHDAGDAVLVTVAGRLHSSLRTGDVLTRFGGDEFAAVCEEVDPAAIERIAERLLGQAAAPIRIGTTETAVTASIGIALSSTGAPDPETLFRNADEAMYTAKRDGKNRYVITLSGTD
jgi:diguanylate cyclase (GGDEF)-like protein/PAS domain S-box-containing protein